MRKRCTCCKRCPDCGSRVQPPDEAIPRCSLCIRQRIGLCAYCDASFFCCHQDTHHEQFCPVTQPERIRIEALWAEGRESGDFSAARAAVAQIVAGN